MPFRISPAPEEFQRRLDQALAGLNGCTAIADDSLVFGCGTNDDEAVKDNDEKLVALLQHCREKGVKLNGGKLQLRLQEVAYMGLLLSADGLQPDPENDKAIRDASTNRQTEHPSPLRDD